MGQIKGTAGLFYKSCSQLFGELKNYTPTRLFSESAHSSQTILAYLRKLKKLQRTFDTAPNLKYNFHIE